MSDPFGPGGDQPPEQGWGAPPPPPSRDRDEGVGEGTGDPNVVAIERADLEPDYEQWLREVAGQVEARLDRVNPEWRSSPQAAAARACAFGLLMGQLAGMYEHARGPLGRVAEIHPSYGSLPAGQRLHTLYELSTDGQRATAWIGPLVGTDDPNRVRQLFD